MSHIFNMSNYCSLCSSSSNIKKYCSRFVGSLEEDALYYCNECYDKVKDDDERLIKFSIQNGENIVNIVKQEYIKDFVNPVSSNPVINPMNIHKIVSEVIDGVNEDFVLINLKEYNNFMVHIICSNKKLLDDEILKKKKEQQERQEAVERRKIEAINEREQREEEKRRKTEEKINLEMKINRYNNEKLKREKEEMKDFYGDIFKENPASIIKKCGFCKELKVYPFHFKDENHKSYLKEYMEDGKRMKSNCCFDCHNELEQRKQEKKINYTYNCHICNSSFMAFSKDIIQHHYSSIKHLRNENKIKGKIDLSLLNVKELNKICSKTLNEDGLYRINNYSKMKKNDLLEKMNAIYDLLVFN